MSNDMIMRLRQQANELEAAQRKISQPAPISQNQIAQVQAQPDIQQIIQQAMVQQFMPAIAPMQQMLGMIGQAYTVEQQQWITANISTLPAFIQSANGKAALGMLLEEFQTFVK